MERVEKGLDGACTPGRSELPQFSDGKWGNSAKIDVNVGAKKMGVWDLFQLDWFLVKPFLVELQHGW